MLKREIEQGNRAVKGNREYWGVERRLQFLVEWLGKVILEPRLDGGMVQSSNANIFAKLPKLISKGCSSAGKESACNAGDPSLISGSGRSIGEGIGYPLQYSRAFLVAQLVKNLLAMWETWV